MVRFCGSEIEDNRERKGRSLYLVINTSVCPWNANNKEKKRVQKSFCIVVVGNINIYVSLSSLYYKNKTQSHDSFIKKIIQQNLFWPIAMFSWNKFITTHGVTNAARLVLSPHGSIIMPLLITTHSSHSKLWYLLCQNVWN